jgi:hypothetical protein
MRLVLIALVIFNVFAIGLSEVQRRTLIERANEIQAARSSELYARITEIEVRYARFMVWQDFKLDRLMSETARITPHQREAFNTSKARDQLRVEQVRVIKSLLEQYRGGKKVYPGPFRDEPAENLSNILATTGIITTIPQDPSHVSYRYTTDGVSDGQSYGLKVTLENGGECLTGVNFERKGWWGAIPPCPF